MRINLAHNVKGAKLAFLKHVLQLVADEFDISTGHLRSHLTSGDPQVGEYVTSWLRDQGWQVSWYQMPRPDKQYLDDEHGEWMWLSFGFVFSDACDKLITWRLSNP